MSTINAQNYGDGTDSVPASAILEGTAKVWASYNNNAGSISQSYNTSSYTDNGTGDATIDFTNNLSSDTFPASTYIRENSASDFFCNVRDQTTSSMRTRTTSSNSSTDDVAQDTGSNGFIHMGDLA